MKQKLSAILLILWFVPQIAFAQTSTIPLPQYSGVQESIQAYLCTPSESADGQDLVRCINRMYRFGITAGAIVLVLMIVVAGYIYITSGETGKTRAKSIVMNSLVGMGILIGSYALLYFINPNLTTFRPIQPPIFTADNLPSCADLGITQDNDCAITSDPAEAIDTSPSGGGGAYADCKGGIVAISGIPRAGSATQICQELLSKMQPLLTQFKTQAPGYYFAISSTIRNGGAESRCHYGGNSKSGNCADTVLRTNAGAKVPGSNAAWGTLCRILLGAGLSLANETGSAHQGCRNPASYKYTNGAHFHVYVPAN